MSILPDYSTPKLTLQQTELKIRKHCESLYNIILDILNKSFMEVWANPYYTPQQVLDQFGSDACELFIFSAKIQDTLLQINPSYEYKSPPYDYIINPDGTVTVGALKEDDSLSDNVDNPSDSVDNPSDSGYLF